MKKRTSDPVRHSREFKGVVKKITGQLTSRPDLERQGRAEMLGNRKPRAADVKSARKRLDQDPHRRG